MQFVNPNGVTATIKQRYGSKEYVAYCSDGDFTKGTKSLADLAKELISAGFHSTPTPKENYLSIEDVISLWDSTPLCVEYSDGSDAMLQDNGYTLDDAVGFALNGCQFFED